MNYQHSRKSFITKLFGIGIAAGVVPSLIASIKQPSSPSAIATESKTPLAKTARFILRTDNRAVSRRDETII